MLITNPQKLKEFYSEQRLWQGIPSIERIKSGRMFACFYSGGVTESLGNYCVLLKSDDDGVTWSEPIAVAYPEEYHRCFDPCLWEDPLGRLWFTWSVSPDHALWAVRCDHPDADELIWTPERIIAHDVMMNKPIACSDGSWIFPVAIWKRGVSAGVDLFNPNERGIPEEKRLAYAYRTCDRGETFEAIGGVDMPERSFDENMITEMKNGSLMMLVRTKYGIGRSDSYDGGRSWSAGRNSGLGGPCSRFCIRRLPSGNLLLVNHYQFRGRNNLYAMISTNDGADWQGHLLLDERNDVSYPDAALDEKGNIYIIYDRERGSVWGDFSLQKVYDSAREILFAKVTEEDIFAGKLVSEGSFLKHTVNRLGEYHGKYADAPQKLMSQFYEESATLGAIMKNLCSRTPQEALASIFGKYGYFCQSLTHDLSAKMDVCISEIMQNELTEDTVAQASAYRELIRLLSGVVPSGPQLSQQEIVVKALEHIRRNLTQELTLQELSDALYLNKYYLCHLFKRETGISVMQYITAQRMLLAKKLLKETEQSVSEIASAVGYDSAAYFTKIFRMAEGISPSAFRGTKK